MARRSLDRMHLVVAALACGGVLSAAAFGSIAEARRQNAARVVKIVGETHKLVLRDDGVVVAWGAWRDGQLGPVAPLTTPNMYVDRLVTIELPGKAIDIAAGTATSFALLADGAVMGWGQGEGGQLGVAREQRPLLSSSTQSMQYRGIERPTRIAGLDNVVSIAAGDTSAYAVLADGTVRAWGSRNIGDGRARQSPTDPPNTKGAALRAVEVPGLANVAAVSTDGAAVLAMLKDGRVFSWGGNFSGMLGRPPRHEHGYPIDTVGEIPGLADVIAIAAGPGVSTALKKDGTVWVWGSNWMAQFGNGQQTAQPNLEGGYELVPQQVAGVTNVVEIAVGLTGRHTLARLKDGSVRFWGNNDWGQGGTGGGTGFVPRPAAVKIAGVARIFAAGNNSFAVKTDGSLWAWGSGGPAQYPLKSNVRVPAPLVLP